MRVAFVNGSHPAMPCGVGDYAAQLALAAQEAGHEVELFTSADPRVRPVAGLAVHPVFRDWTVAQFARHHRRLRAARPDLVVAQYPSVLPGPHSRLLFLLPLLVRATLRARTLLVVHEYAHTHPAAQRQLALAFRFADDVVAVNPVDEAAIRRRHPGLAVRAAAIGSNIPRVDGGPVDTGPLFFFGLLGPDKGLDVLLEALTEVDAHLEIAGEPDP